MANVTVTQSVAWTHSSFIIIYFIVSHYYESMFLKFKKHNRLYAAYG